MSPVAAAGTLDRVVTSISIGESQICPGYDPLKEDIDSQSPVPSGSSLSNHCVQHSYREGTRRQKKLQGTVKLENQQVRLKTTT